MKKVFILTILVILCSCQKEKFDLAGVPEPEDQPKYKHTLEVNKQ